MISQTTHLELCYISSALEENLQSANPGSRYLEAAEKPDVADRTIRYVAVQVHHPPGILALEKSCCGSEIVRRLGLSQHRWAIGNARCGFGAALHHRIPEIGGFSEKYEAAIAFGGAVSAHLVDEGFPRMGIARRRNQTRACPSAENKSPIGHGWCFALATTRLPKIEVCNSSEALYAFVLIVTLASLLFSSLS